MNEVIEVLLIGLFLLIVLSYVIAGGALIYHIITFGLNRSTALVSSLFFVVFSGFILFFIWLNISALIESLSS